MREKLTLFNVLLTLIHVAVQELEWQREEEGKGHCLTFEFLENLTEETCTMK